MPEQAEQTQALAEQGPDNIVAIAPFENWTYEDAKKAMDDQLFTDYNITERYCVDKDHFQRGTQWVGPGDARTNLTIQNQFAPDDVVGEALSNIENAFSEPQVGATPIADNDDISEETRTKIDELQKFLTEWWDEQRLQEHLLERVRTAAWAGWSGLRIFIPWRFLIKGQDGKVRIQKADTFEDALSMIHIMAPKPKHGAVLIDNSTRDKVMVFLDTETEYTNGKRKDYSRAELMYLEPGRGLDREAKLIIRVVYGNEEKPGTRAELPLNGRFLGAEMRTNRVITEPVLRTQRQLNLVTTIITRLAETAAFRERYTTNAKPQGLRIPYTHGDSLRDGAFIERDEEGREWQVVPIPRTLGANTTTELIGLATRDPAGEVKGHETPGVIFADPVDPKPYIEAGDGIRRRILRMCGQGHLGGVSNAESSGIAYEQARSVFEKLLDKIRVPEEGMVRDLLLSVVTLAEVISSTQGYYTNELRITVDQHINPGPRSPDLVRLDLESYEAGAASLQTTLARLGNEDTEAETERIKRSSAFILGVLEKITATQGFTKESILEVLKKLELPEDLIDLLEVEEIVPPDMSGAPGNELENEPGNEPEDE